MRIHHTPLILSVVLLACSSDSSTRRGEVGVYEGPDGSTAGQGSAGAAGSGTAGAAGTIGNTDNALTVRVDDIDGMTIEIITLTCAGECADVQAVARGGNPPYAFTWEDGSTNAARRVCLDASARLTVSATDTAIDADEFDYEAQTARTELTATVLDCEDAGAPDGAVPEGDLCIENPSLEGTPQVNTSGMEIDLPQWTICTTGQTPHQTSVWDESLSALGQTVPSPAPTDGESYLRLSACSGIECSLFGGSSDAVSPVLCAPVRAGRTYSFQVDLASPGELGANFGNSPGKLVVMAGDAECMLSDLLWTSPALSPGFNTYCASFTPARDAAALSFSIEAADGLKLVYIDNIVPVAACP